MRTEQRELMNRPQQSRVETMAGYHHNYGNGNFDKPLGQWNSDRFATFESMKQNHIYPNGFGHEQEMICKATAMQDVYMYMLKNVAYKALPDGLFKTQTDCSLIDSSSGQTSGESITQCMSKSFIRNQYPAWRDFFAHLEAMHTSAYYSENGYRHCGMHVNVSASLFGDTEEKRQTAIRKMVYIVNKFRKTLSMATGRDFNQSHYYCEMRDWRSAKTNETYIFDHCGGHGDCVNISHYHPLENRYDNAEFSSRVELRFVGGQKDFRMFRNTYELIFFLVDRVKKISWDDCDDIAKIFRGCNQYVAEALCYANPSDSRSLFHTEVANPNISAERRQDILDHVKQEVRF